MDEIIENKEIIRHPELTELDEMKTMWKSTFGDSDEYVDLVLDNYFNPMNSLVCTVDSKIVAVLHGIVYSFRSGDGLDANLKGLYLCGLSTQVDMQGRGIMGRMIKDIENIAISRDYNFLFLIPADDHLRRYYTKFGFVDSAYLRRLYVSYPDNIQCFQKCIQSLFLTTEEADNSNCLRDICDMHSVGYKYINSFSELCLIGLDELIEKCMNAERDAYECRIIHSRKDWEIIFEEHFLSGGKAVYFKHGLDEILLLLKSDSEVIKLFPKCRSVEDDCRFIDSLKFVECVKMAEVSKYGMVKFLKDNPAESGLNIIGSEVHFSLMLD